MCCNAYYAQISFYTKAQKLTGTFNVYHFSPPALNEKTSAEVIDLFIANLDSRGTIIKERDHQLLLENNRELFNQINSNSNDYVTKATKIYLNALHTADSVLSQLAIKKLNFKENDTIFLIAQDSKKTFYAKDLKAYANKLERFVKWKSYENTASTDNYEKLSEEEFNSKAETFAKSIISNLQKNIKSDLQNVDVYVESTLLNAIALRYDPHSNYFTNEQNQEFSTQLSGQVNSFGFYLDEQDGTIIIGHMDPGGSAWLSNEINEGDIFIAVKINNEKITAENHDAYDIQEKIDKTEESILLVIQKPNGLVKQVKLIKQKMASDDNVVKGYVLSSGKTKTGYISIPSFYTDMEDHNLPGCANDVAKELLKLENDSISGLIIDLRNNGGGSMEEAMNLAGIFIDEGPLFIIKEKNKKPSLVKDINRGSIFKKPIVVMINEASASASELFANIVKDYNLGAVVGQQSYGKGTAQNILPLDTNLIGIHSKVNNKNNSDFIKLTTSKFYRLNNSTHQGTGVVPDIVLPSTPGYSSIKENKELFYLSADSIVKKVVFTPHAPINYQSLRDQSSSRLSASNEFKRFKQVADSVSLVISKSQKVPLKFKDYKRFKKETDVMYESLENAFLSKTGTVKCYNNTFDQKLEEVNESAKEFNLKIRQSVQQDIFINESYYILNDLINLHP